MAGSPEGAQDQPAVASAWPGRGSSDRRTASGLVVDSIRRVNNENPAMLTVNIHEAKTHLSRLVERAAQGESFIIAKAGHPFVCIFVCEMSVYSGVHRCLGRSRKVKEIK